MLLRIGHKRGGEMSLWAQISGVSGLSCALIGACRGHLGSILRLIGGRYDALLVTKHESTPVLLPRLTALAHQGEQMTVALMAFSGRGRRRLRYITGSKSVRERSDPFSVCVFLTTPTVKASGASR
jgi:hypothetical protein